MRQSKSEALFGLDEILAVLPHRPPFLFVDRVMELHPGKSIRAEYDLRGDEPFFAGHFPGKPIMPGVLTTDALAQTSGLLWGLTKSQNLGGTLAAPEVMFLASATMKYLSPAFPGDTLQLKAWAKSTFGPFFVCDVEATVGKNVTAKGTLTLAETKEER